MGAGARCAVDHECATECRRAIPHVRQPEVAVKGRGRRSNPRPLSRTSVEFGSLEEPAVASVAPAWREVGQCLADVGGVPRARGPAARQPFGKVEAYFASCSGEAARSGRQEADEVGSIDDSGPQAENESAELRIVSGGRRSRDRRAPGARQDPRPSIGHVLNEGDTAYMLWMCRREGLADAITLLDHGDAPDGPCSRAFSIAFPACRRKARLVVSSALNSPRLPCLSDKSADDAA